jgi:hypothetical protein
MVGGKIDLKILAKFYALKSSEYERVELGKLVSLSVCMYA